MEPDILRLRCLKGDVLLWQMTAGFKDWPGFWQVSE